MIKWLQYPVGLVYLLAVVADDLVGFGNRRLLRRFKAHRIGNCTLRELLDVRASTVSWAAQHRDLLHETYVTCLARDIGICTWVVSTASPVPWVDKQPLYITPTTPAAAQVLPELIPSGMSLATFPTGGPYAASAIYCLANPAAAQTWLAPLFGRLGAGESQVGGLTMR
jgi:hypothetical protein